METALRDAERLVEQAVDDGLGRSRHGRLAIGALELAEDLRFAEHHGVEAGRHGEQVVDRFPSLMDVDIGGELHHLPPLGGGPCLKHESRNVALTDGEDFDAVAGGKNQRLIQRRFRCAVFARGAERNGPRLFGAVIRQCETFPYLNSGGAVVEPNEIDLLFHISVVWSESCGGSS